MYQKVQKYKIYFAISLAIAAVAVAIFFGMKKQQIAIVNGHAISEEQFRASMAHASVYYGNIQKAYGKGVTEGIPSASDMETGILTSLIEDELITEKLEADLGRVWSDLVSEKLKSVKDSPDTRQTAAVLYGMDWGNFKREILSRQARKDILSDQLFLKKQKIEDWLVVAKKAADVKIFSQKFSWDGSKIVENSN